MIGKKSEIIAPEINLFPLQGKNIELSFNGDRISSDGGLLLLRELDSQLNLLSSASNCVHDERDQRYIDHSIKELLTQRVFQYDINNDTYEQQELALFNNYYRENCYMPLLIYERLSEKLITTILRPGRRNKQANISRLLQKLISYLRMQLPETKIIVRGDSHFASPKGVPVRRFTKTVGKLKTSVIILSKRMLLAPPSLRTIAEVIFLPESSMILKESYSA